jgi:hypothetical protein
MQIDDAVYISREIGSDVEFSAPNFSSLSESMENDAKVATRIIIVSGYFGTGYLLDLLGKPTKQRRKKCIVKLILGYDNLTEFVYEKIKEEDLRRKVVALGYTNKFVTVRLFRDAVPLHTKLYGFLRTTKPVWYVGSANASDAITGKRHELMLRVSGKIVALEKYVKALLEHQTKVTITADGENLSIQEYLSKGFLIFKPSKVRRFTYDAFSIKSEERKKISDQLGVDSRVPHADPGAEGFGFNLLSALDMNHETREVKASRLYFSQFRIETAYGYWVPQAYISKIKEALSKSRRSEACILQRISEALAARSDSDLIAEFHSYRSSAEAFFNRLNVNIQKKNEDSFLRFLKAKRALLSDKNWIERASSKITISPMPDIWSDESASDRFITSFIDDLVLMLNAAGKTPLIYKELKRFFRIPDYPDVETVKRILRSGS